MHNHKNSNRSDSDKIIIDWIWYRLYFYSVDYFVDCIENGVSEDIVSIAHNNMNVKKCDNNETTVIQHYHNIIVLLMLMEKVEIIVKDTKRVDQEFVSGNELLSTAQVSAAVDLGLQNTLNINAITGLKRDVNVSVADRHNFSLILRNYPIDNNKD